MTSVARRLTCLRNSVQVFRAGRVGRIRRLTGDDAPPQGIAGEDVIHQRRRRFFVKVRQLV